MQTETASPSCTPHEGRNVKRIREILGIKQETLALDLGISQQAISQLEGREALDKEMLEKVAAALKVPTEAIQNFSEVAAINIVSSTLHHTNGLINYFPSFNPIEKIVQLYDEKIALYERMLKDKQDMIGQLQELQK
ncbi:MAG: helix-turn-helix transcriptional regulator [Flaviaesturariibacter sp.]|nr:helix-turn-helix transcriptional regulator [Flaviaesturariibacter sp.]